MPKHAWIETREKTVKEMPCVTAVCSCGWTVDAMIRHGWLGRVRSAFRYHRLAPGIQAGC